LIIAFASIINIILNLIAVPILGINGAAGSTMLALFMMSAACILFSRKYMKVNININLIEKISLASLLLFLIMKLGPSSNIFIIILTASIGLFIYIASLFALKAISRREVNFAINLLSKST
jgi:O-antigen/teichoic acid export membrane protein